MAIVKMKKISLVLFDKYREESLKKLRGLGVLHLEKIDGSGETYDELYARGELLKNAEAHLPSEESEKTVDFNGIEDAVAKAEEILAAGDRLKAVSDRKNAIAKELERIEALGDFEPDMFQKLSDSGLEAAVYSAAKADSGFFNEAGAFRVASTKSRDYFAVIGETPEDLAGFDKFVLPEKSINGFRGELDELAKQGADIEAELLEMTSWRKLLETAAEKSAVELEFESVRSGINVEEKLSYLRGYCPVPVLEALKTEAAESGWGLIIEDPSEEDEVPTQLKLGKFASLLTPVTDFLGILPGYREHDISFFFLCFFSVFTAMLIGDAGYGLLFLGATIAGMIAMKAKTGKVSKMLFLPMLLSVTTIIYGAVSGTWFASQSIMTIPFFNSLKLDAFKVDQDAQISLVMGISFFLGIVQLLIGVVQNFKKNFPKLSSFAQIGWFAVLVAVYYLVLTLVVKRAGLETYPKEMLYVLLGGVVMIFIFGQQEEGKSFIKGILSSFANFLNLFLDVVGTFSDIMSYVRLFAVGLASVKIAETFNQLGAGMSDGPIIIFGIVIVILGHSINIVLGLMAILVHAVRLNILEYSGKVGVEWSGFKYEPFKLNTDEN